MNYHRLATYTTKSGPSSTHQRNTIKMAFPWWADDGPTMNVGLVALCYFSGSSIAKKPYRFVIDQGGGLDPVSSLLDPCMNKG